MLDASGRGSCASAGVSNVERLDESAPKLYGLRSLLLPSVRDFKRATRIHRSRCRGDRRIAAPRCGAPRSVLIPPRRTTVGLAVLTLGFIIIATLVFAALSVSSLALWAFPIVVSLWIAFLWVFVGKGVAAFSAPPHPPRRAIAIIIAFVVLAVVALTASILAGLLILGPRSAGF
jgi:hypothetical protein